MSHGFSLSPQQRRLWSVQKDNLMHTAVGAVRIEGNLDQDRLVKAIEQAVADYDALRAGCQVSADLLYPLQVPGESPDFAVAFSDLAGVPAGEQEAALQGKFEAGWEAGLPATPLLRAELVRLSAEAHVLILRVPALNADTASLQILFDTLFAYHAGSVDPEREPVIQYMQFAEWQNNLLREPDEDSLAFWHKYDYAGYRIQPLPFGRPQPEAPAFKPAVAGIRADAQLFDALRAVASGQDAAVAHLLLAALKVLIAKHTGSDQVGTGVVTANRDYEELQTAVGLIAKILPVVVTVDPDESFASLLARTDELMATLVGWSDSFLVPQADDQSQGPAMIPLGFEYTAEPGPRGAGVAVSTRWLDSPIDRFTLKLGCLAGADGVQLNFYYDSGVYDEKAVRLLGQQYHTLLTSIAAAPAAAVRDLSVLSGQEAASLLSPSNLPGAPAPGEGTITQLFEARAAAQPRDVAVEFENTSLTYGELNERANQLAHYLRHTCGLAPNDKAGILMHPSERVITAILGTLKAGAAYLPIDPEFPEARIKYLLDDAAVKVLLVDDPQLADQYRRAGYATCSVQDNWPAIARFDRTNPDPRNTAADLAYVIYTSGSTGNPKGVEVQIDSLVNYVSWANACYFDHQKGHCFGLFTPLTFDLTITAVFSTLLRGDALRVYKYTDVSEAIQHAFGRHSDVNTLKITPAHVRLLSLLEIRHTNVQTVILGGEALTLQQVDLLRALNPQMRIFNEYGPTETTVGCTAKEISRQDRQVTIGRPIANTQLYILNDALALQATGVVGEIYVGGKGVARGYLNRPDLTAEKFIKNPFGADENARMYKTGDLGRWLPDGEIDYLNRKDAQVKISGFRIEPGEVEHILAGYGPVRQVVVAAKADEEGSKQLVAYYTSDTPLDLADVKGFLSRQLPGYMVPSFFIPLKSFPYTRNGKVDYKALPDPREAALQAAAPYTAPGDAVEKQIEQIWQGVLTRQQISVYDNFFDLGGNSIKLIKLFTQLNKLHAGKVKIADLFSNPTILGQAAILRGQSTEDARQDASEIIEIEL